MKLTVCLILFYYSDVEEGQNDEEMEMPGRFESAKEASLLLFLGVFGQSWDVYSDIALSIQFANGEVKVRKIQLDHIRFAKSPLNF